MDFKAYFILRKAYIKKFVEYPNSDKHIEYLLKAKYLTAETILNKDMSNPIWWKSTGRYSLTLEGTKAYFNFKTHLTTRAISVIGLVIAILSLILR